MLCSVLYQAQSVDIDGTRNSLFVWFSICSGKLCFGKIGCSTLGRRVKEAVFILMKDLKGTPSLNDLMKVVIEICFFYEKQYKSVLYTM
jgi:hypothetical protein